MIQFFSFLLNSTARILPSWNGKIAFNLMCRVKRVHKENIPNSFLDAATTTKLIIDGYEGTVYKLGNGVKKILFLHGWKSHSARWAPVVHLLDLEEYTCYALDAPAHGRSAGDSLQLEIYRKLVVQIMANAGGLHAIVAHSLGGLVTAYAFLLDPGIPVNRFIITGAPAGMDSIYGFFQHMVKLNHTVINNMDRYISKNVTGMEPSAITLDSFFEKLEKPLLVIHDKDDKICPIEPLKQAAATNPGIETYFTDGLGHDLKSTEVFARIVSFLEA